MFDLGEIRRTVRGNKILLTNFDKETLHIYQKALELYIRYIDVKDRYELEIDTASNKDYDYGLWYTKKAKSGKDMSLYWDLQTMVKTDSTSILKYLTEDKLLN